MKNSELLETPDWRVFCLREPKVALLLFDLLFFFKLRLLVPNVLLIVELLILLKGFGFIEKLFLARESCNWQDDDCFTGGLKDMWPNDFNLFTSVIVLLELTRFFWGLRDEFCWKKLWIFLPKLLFLGLFDVFFYWKKVILFLLKLDKLIDPFSIYYYWFLREDILCLKLLLLCSTGFDWKLVWINFELNVPFFLVLIGFKRLFLWLFNIFLFLLRLLFLLWDILYWTKSVSILLPWFREEALLFCSLEKWWRYVLKQSLNFEFGFDEAVFIQFAYWPNNADVNLIGHSENSDKIIF